MMTAVVDGKCFPNQFPDIRMAADLCLDGIGDKILGSLVLALRIAGRKTDPAAGNLSLRPVEQQQSKALAGKMLGLSILADKLAVLFPACWYRKREAETLVCVDTVRDAPILKPQCIRRILGGLLSQNQSMKQNRDRHEKKAPILHHLPTPPAQHPRSR